MDAHAIRQARASVTTPDNYSSTISYNGLSTTSRNALGQTRTEQRNVLGELVKVTDALGTPISYSYDAAGNVVKTTVGSGSLSSSTTIDYDSLGRKTRMIDPDKGTWRYAYNAFGELVEQIDAKSQRSVMAYDVLGRMRTRTDYWSNGKRAHLSQWQYDTVSGQATKAGQLITSHARNYNTAGTGITSQHYKTFSYDNFGRPTGYGVNINGTEQQAVETITYDEHSRTFQHFDMTGDHWGVEYAYTTRGYLSKVMESRYVNEDDPRLAYRTIQNMDAMGHVTKELLGNGTTVSRSYDANVGRLTHLGGSHGAFFNRQDTT